MSETAGDPASPLSAEVERLYAAASHHTRAANSKVISPDPHVRMEAAIHIGGAVELIAKAILANIDPRLVLDDREGHHLFVDVLAEQGKTTVLPRVTKDKPKTVMASRAVDLVARVCEAARPHVAAANEALGARNAAAHAAVVSDDKLRDQVTRGTTFVLAGVDSFARDRATFLGQELANAVEHQVAAHDAALRANAHRKLNTARHRYGQLVDRLPDGTHAVVLAELATRTPSNVNHSAPYDCPACANQGWLNFDVIVEEEYEGPGEYSAYAFEVFLGFDCFFCGLRLGASECAAVGILPHGDPADAFEVYDKDADTSPGTRR